MSEALCVKGCGGRARRNPESKGMCLECSLKEENKSIKRKTSSVAEVCACGAKSIDLGATRFKDGKCKKCRSKEAQQRWYEKHKKGEARKRSPEAKPGSEARKRSPEAKPGSEARKPTRDGGLFRIPGDAREVDEREYSRDEAAGDADTVLPEDSVSGIRG